MADRGRPTPPAGELSTDKLPEPNTKVKRSRTPSASRDRRSRCRSQPPSPIALTRLATS